MRHGIKLNGDPRSQLEYTKTEWARQLAIYGWLLGEPVGGDFVVAIDQIVCGNGVVEGIAQHRCSIGSLFQKETYDEARALWALCHSDWFFRDLSKGSSKIKQDMLDMSMDAELLRMAKMTAGRE